MFRFYEELNHGMRERTFNKSDFKNWESLEDLVAEKVKDLDVKELLSIAKTYNNPDTEAESKMMRAIIERFIKDDVIDKIEDLNYMAAYFSIIVKYRNKLRGNMFIKNISRRFFEL